MKNLFENQSKSLAETSLLTEALSKQHYEAMAEILNKHKTMHPEMHRSMSEHMATHFQQDNPRFNRAMFMKAAGVDDKSSAKK